MKGKALALLALLALAQLARGAQWAGQGLWERGPGGGAPWHAAS